MEASDQNNELIKIVKSLIQGDANRYSRLESLIEKAQLEKSLLNISSFENISFHINKKQVIFLPDEEIHRLSLVHPPSYEVNLPIQVAGYYYVKYSNSNVKLPMQLPIFSVLYSCIAIKQKKSFLFQNEEVKLLGE
jgi:hypothetical protein